MNVYVLSAAFILDVILSDPSFMHPVSLIGKWLAFTEKRLMRLKNLKNAGLIYALFNIFITAAVYFIIAFFLKPYFLVYLIFNTVVCFYSLSAMSLFKESMKVYKALEKEDINGARRALSFIVGRDTQNLNGTKIINAAVETIAENTSDGFIAPAFYILLFGPAGGVIYKTINTMDSRVGYKNDKYGSFGFYAAKIDDAANFLPSRVTALLYLIVSSIYGKKIFKRTYDAVKKYGSAHESPNAGYPEAAAAGILGLRLGGPSDYSGKSAPKPYIGDAVNKAQSRHIKKINLIMLAVSALFILIPLILKYLFLDN